VAWVGARLEEDLGHIETKDPVAALGLVCDIQREVLCGNYVSRGRAQRGTKQQEREREK
jgi:hypothetical protein